VCKSRSSPLFVQAKTGNVICFNAHNSQCVGLRFFADTTALILFFTTKFCWNCFSSLITADFLFQLLKEGCGESSDSGWHEHRVYRLACKDSETQGPSRLKDSPSSTPPLPGHDCAPPLPKLPSIPSLPIQRPGLRTRVRCRRTSAPTHVCRRFFVLAFPCNGGCAWETFGSAGFLYLRFLSLRIAATLSPENGGGSAHLIQGVSQMNSINPSKFCTPVIPSHRPANGR
jgi:hypothetical protein